MTTITIASNTQATRTDGRPVIVVQDVPDPVARLIMDRAITAMRNAGYRIQDQRRSDEPVCPRCQQRPPASPRAKYCCICQADLILESKRRHSAILT